MTTRLCKKVISSLGNAFSAPRSQRPDNYDSRHINRLAMLRYLALPFRAAPLLLLDHAAHGRPGAPILSMEDANPLGETRPLLYGVSVAVFYLATAALGEITSPGVASALHLLGLLALPAILATHTITGSFAEALSPATVVGVTRRLGSCYFVILCVALAVAGPDAPSRWASNPSTRPSAVSAATNGRRSTSTY